MRTVERLSLLNCWVVVALLRHARVVDCFSLNIVRHKVVVGSARSAFSVVARRLSARDDAPNGEQQTTASVDAKQIPRVDWDEMTKNFVADVSDLSQTVVKAFSPLFQTDASVTAKAILAICDDLDAVNDGSNDSNSSGSAVSAASVSATTTRVFSSLRRQALQTARYELLSNLMRQDYASYVSTASYLSPSRIPRLELPNVQDIPYIPEVLDPPAAATAPIASPTNEGGVDLVPDCTLSTMVYKESLLDKLLLSIFRKLVTKHTGGVTSDLPGIQGLLQQGRTYMLQPNQTADAQHTMVSSTLASLMTPVLPPFYRIFMSGIVPKIEGVVPASWQGRQIGPWFYAPLLTSIVTPTFFGFLVGPSRPNRRKDGAYGGLVVEKCKFLQESGCKGLCLHQCKLPAQQFFADTLGLPLTVTPNFVTQECQWSFGEEPLEVADDPSFPKGCLVGCASRKAVNELQQTGNRAFVDLCN